MNIPLDEVQLGEHPVDQEMLAVIAKGKDFDALFSHAVYQRILDWMEDRANAALTECRQAALTSDDRVKSNLLLKWTVTEELMKAFQIMVQEAIHERSRIISDLGESDETRT